MRRDLAKLLGLTLACTSLQACSGRDADTESSEAEADTSSDTVYIPPQPNQSASQASTANESSSSWGLVSAGDDQPMAQIGDPSVTFRPVLIGRDGPTLDACGSVGEVTGLNASGDNFLAVRALPTASGAMLDKLGPKQIVWLCDANDEATWLGVVYDKSGNASCDVGSPVRSPRPYEGQCQQGWVYGKYVTVIAG
jgi:hypothetical protein